MIKVLVGCSVLVTGVVALAACEGKVDSSDEPAPIGEYAAFVAKKKDWLEGYDRHCEACFVAFELCEKGARDDDELVACQVALEACMRGGLIVNGEDGGVDDGDGGNDDADADGGVDDADADVVGDGGIDDDDDDGDEDDQIDEDQDAGGDADAGAGDDDDADDDGDADDDADDGDGADGGDDELVEAVGVCLEEGKGCLASDDTEVRQCLSDLKQCVKGVLAGRFESICSEQVRACRAEGGSREKIESVERQCRSHLQI